MAASVRAAENINFSDTVPIPELDSTIVETHFAELIREIDADYPPAREQGLQAQDEPHKERGRGETEAIQWVEP
jgi:hypothetical protein